MKTITKTDKYDNIITIIFAIIITSTIAQTAISLIYGLVNGAWMITIIQYIGFPTAIGIVGYYWPSTSITAEGRWSRFWSRFWAGLFNVGRIGYERPGIKSLPWGMIVYSLITYGSIMGLFQFDYQLQLGTAADPAVIIGLIQWVVSTISIVVGFAVMYGVGYMFGGRRQRRLQA